MRTGKEKSSKTLTIYLKMRHVSILQYYVEWKWIPKYKICKKTSSFVMTTCRKNKGGQQSLFLYVTEALKWPPMDGMTPNFACTEHLGCKSIRNIFGGCLASDLQNRVSGLHS